jgi:hypothetical protein
LGKKHGVESGAVCYTARCTMNSPSLSQLIPILQLAVGPVILISGVGLLQLSLTNRLGRLIDRARLLSRERTAAPAGDSPRLDAQLAIIDRRARILRGSITLGALTVLLVSLLILTLFISALLQLEAGLAIVALFCCALLTLIGSNLLFIREMNLSLEAVHLEVRRE